MKKIFVAMMVLCAAVSANAQKTTVVSPKFFDNWLISVNGGMGFKTTNTVVFKNLNPTAGLTVGKYITPIYGIALNGEVAFDAAPVTFTYGNPTNCGTAVAGSVVTLENLFNLNNIFAGYSGRPNLCEVVAVAGAGWGHNFGNSNTKIDGWKGANYLTSKFGVQVNFNLGKARAWQVGIEPSINYTLAGNGCLVGLGNADYLAYNVNNSWVNCVARVAYKFKNSNGTHNFVVGQLRDQAEIDGLNAKINDLRAQVSDRDGQISADQRLITDLRKKLADCESTPKTVVTNGEKVESVVSFKQGKSRVEATQMANIERIAAYMSAHDQSTLLIKGYASPEGSKKFNEKLATARAKAVKKILVKTYGISEDRIVACGQGVGEIFSKPAMNRVAISTVDAK